jgi:hypothetical protein
MKKSKQLKKKLPLSKAKIKVELKYYARQIGGYGTFFLVVLSFGWLMNKELETLLIIAGYFATRFCVPKIKHFDSTQKCISVTTLTFLLAIAIVCIPHTISLVWSVLVGAVIPLVMYAESLLFDVKVSDKDKLIALCKQHNYNTLKTEMAVKFFIDKEKPREVWLWLCETQDNAIDWDSVRKAKYRMRKELFSDIRQN